MTGTITQKTKLSKVKRIKRTGRGMCYVGWSEDEWMRSEQTFQGGKESRQIMCGKNIPRGKSNRQECSDIHVTARRPAFRMK